MATLYTFGYLSSKAERIITELIATSTPIVDVRYNPTSRNWRYTQDVLKRRTGVLYHHLPELGNELYKEALTGKFDEPHVRLHDEIVGMARLKGILDTYGKAAIFCACSSKKTCHRIMVADMAKSQFGVQVVYL